MNHAFKISYHTVYVRLDVYILTLLMNAWWLKMQDLDV
jgi:hypothetical protein